MRATFTNYVMTDKGDLLSNRVSEYVNFYADAFEARKTAWIENKAKKLIGFMFWKKPIGTARAVGFFDKSSFYDENSGDRGSHWIEFHMMERTLDILQKLNHIEQHIKGGTITFSDEELNTLRIAEKDISETK